MREIATEEKWDRLRNLNSKLDGGRGEGVRAGWGVEGGRGGSRGVEGWVKRCLGLDKLYSNPRGDTPFNLGWGCAAECLRT